MAAIGDAWADGAWVEASWNSGAWEGGGGGAAKVNMPMRQMGHIQGAMRGLRAIILLLFGA